MVIKQQYVPERGDIVWLSFSPAKGHEQKGRRPGLVLTSRNFNAKSGIMFAVPITSKVRGYGTEVAISTSNVSGVALVHQLKTIDWKSRKVEFAGKIYGDTLKKIQNIAVSLIEND
jgi:mRNA interferase MazF